MSMQELKAFTMNFPALASAEKRYVKERGRDITRGKAKGFLPNGFRLTDKGLPYDLLRKNVGSHLTIYCLLEKILITAIELIRGQLLFETEGVTAAVQGKVTSIRHYGRPIMTQEIEKELC
uniref:Uncharacterized protein n=1 Tax=Glossina pallidipes TaxID=7398 RepID=A0A1B0ADR8_GLOPL